MAESSLKLYREKRDYKHDFLFAKKNLNSRYLDHLFIRIVKMATRKKGHMITLNGFHSDANNRILCFLSHSPNEPARPSGGSRISGKGVQNEMYKGDGFALLIFSPFS